MLNFNFLNFKIALRFVFYKFKKSLLISFGIALGIAVQLFVGIIIDSTQNNLINRTLGSTYHIIIKPLEDANFLNNKIENPDLVLDKFFNRLEKNLKKVNFSVEGNILISSLNLNKNYPAKLVGYFNYFNGDFLDFKNNIKMGRFIENKNEVVIGEGLFKKLNINLNDYITLIFNKNFYSYKVVGYFSFNNSQIDDFYVVLDYEKVQEILGYRRKEFSNILIQVNDVFKANEIKNLILKEISYLGYEIKDWQEQNRQLLNAISAQSSSGLSIQFFILISIFFSILSILNMTIMEKYKEIGIMKSFGFKNKSIRLIFIYMALILGFMGIVLGLIFSYFILNFFVQNIKGPDGGPLFKLVFKWQYILGSLFFNLFSIFFAGYISSRKVTKLDPVKIIVNN